MIPMSSPSAVLDTTPHGSFPAPHTAEFAVHYDTSLLTDQDLFLFNEGTHFRLYNKLGAHPLSRGSQDGTFFAVWAPSARQVCVMGDFNGWNNSGHSLRARGDSGIWEGFIPGVRHGESYKFHVRSHFHGYEVDKADPFAFCQEIPPRTASIVWDLNYTWGDADWMARRAERQGVTRPMAIYEVHLGSWARVPEDGYRSLSYRELAPRLAEYVKKMGFTHVEFLPLMEHPFFGSWGYQVTGFFGASRRFGNPQDLMYLIDYLHKNGIAVIMDWVPAHFPTDQHGLGFFDGTHLYEHADPRKGWHPDWQSAIFNYGRHEVRSFLISSALFWLDRYHVDGLRVDAVASMLYLDYSRNKGEWLPNEYGGRENLDAISFVRRFNEEAYKHFPGVQMVAEESTSWAMVSRPVYVGGLGFGFKWDMGWMHDTLLYICHDPVHRRHHHNEITFRMLYAFTENFILPLSHDEVVHGKGSLLGKMPGDIWQKFANLRLLFGYMYGQAGKKLLFMGSEIAQWSEWNHDSSVEWHLAQYPPHAGMQKWVADLNHLYQREPSLHEWDCHPGGFEWVDCNDSESSTLSFLRRGQSSTDWILVLCNFTPVPRFQYHVGVPVGGFWRELLNGDSTLYGGSGIGNAGGLEAKPVSCHRRPFSLEVTLPPLAVVFFKSQNP
jgi:1,4-alpha-glucan branching enzyme